MSQADTTIIIPAYNEAKNLTVFLPQVIEFCKQHEFELIVVNDGSQDETGQVLEDLGGNPFRYINHKRNKGYGAAIKTGIRECRTKYVVTIDADGQHRLEDVLLLQRTRAENGADMVVGNRRTKGNKSFYRSLGKWIIRRIAKILLPDLNVKDINSGMKIYDRELAEDYIRLCPDTMAFSDVILLSFIKRKTLVMEIPVQVNPRVEGKSTVNTWTALETIWEIFLIVILFNPIRIFFPISCILILSGMSWAMYFLIENRGLTTASATLILTGVICFLLGLIAEQLSILITKML